LKKLLTVLLVVALVLGLGSVALAAGFSDTTDLSKDIQGSINKLSALSIISGYPDGTFKPANTITRAEFAKIACIAGGMGANADVLKSSTSKFTDVAAGQWYTGFVNLANSQGWVKGFPDGTFRPNATITYAEVITVLTRLLGYNDNLPGPWPVDYIAKAGALDITEDVSFDANSAATRVDVAVMADATLDCTIVKWDNDTEDFEEDEDDTTLLEDSFDSAVNDDYYIADSKYDNGTWKIKVEATDEDEEGLATYSDENDGSQPSKWYDLADNVVVSDDSLPTGLGGKIADLVYNDDDEVIVFINVTSTSVSLDGEDLDIDADDIENSDNGTNDDDDDYTYGTKYDVDGKNYDIADWVVDTERLIPNPDANRYYKVRLNSDGEIFDISAKNNKTPAIVDEYDADSAELSLKDPGNHGAYEDIEDIDFDSDDVLIESDTLGKFIEPSELKENDLLLVDEDPDAYGYDYYIEVLTGIDQEGTLDGFEEGEDADDLDQIEISGEWYDVAGTTLLSTDGGEDFDGEISNSDLEDSYDATIKYALNGCNQVTVAISDADGSEGNTSYGVVTEVVDTNASGKITKIKVMKKDGTESSYTVDTSDVEVYYAHTDGTYTGKELDVDDFIKFSVNDDNEVDNLTILAYDNGGGPDGFTDPSAAGSANVRDDYSDEDSADYIGEIIGGDDDNNRITFTRDSDGRTISYKVNDSTIVFNADPANDDDVAEIVDVDDLVDWASDSSITDKYAYVQYDGTTVDYIFIHSDVSGSTDVDFAAVLKAYTKSSDDWVRIDAKGNTENYEVKSGNPDKGSIYNYSITGNKFSTKRYTGYYEDGSELEVTSANAVFDPEDSVVADTYGKVNKVDKSELTLTLTDDTNVILDADTVIYDYSDYYDDGSDPDYCSSISSISKNDWVWYVLDEDGNADLVVIINNNETLD